jgi:hypothetical protein
MGKLHGYGAGFSNVGFITLECSICKKQYHSKNEYWDHVCDPIGRDPKGAHSQSTTNTDTERRTS